MVQQHHTHTHTHNHLREKARRKEGKHTQKKNDPKGGRDRERERSKKGYNPWKKTARGEAGIDTHEKKNETWALAEERNRRHGLHWRLLRERANRQERHVLLYIEERKTLREGAEEVSQQ